MVEIEAFDNRSLQHAVNANVIINPNQADDMYRSNIWPYGWPEQCDNPEPDLDSPDLDGPWTACKSYTTFSNEPFSWDDTSLQLPAESMYSDCITETQVPSLGLSSNLSSPTTLYQLSPTARGGQYQSLPNAYQQDEAFLGASRRFQPLDGKKPSLSRRASSIMVADARVPSERASCDASPGEKIDEQRHPSVNSSNGEHGQTSRRGTRHKKIQERNRVAANKFRTRKREDATKLQIDTEDMENEHRQLFESAKSLTKEVHELKMQLLQHSDCNCKLIQDYIKHEAQQYIHRMDPGSSLPS